MSEGPIAVLPMYDYPWTAAANDRLWAAMSARLNEAGVPAPASLTRGGDRGAQWRDPKLVFGQTCGYPYVTGLKDAVALIATPEYSFPGCEGASHRSFIVARANDARRDLSDYRGARAAVNGFDSNSGMNLFRAKIAAIQVKIGILSFAFHALANCRFRNYGCGWWWCSDIQSRYCGDLTPGTASVERVAG